VRRAQATEADGVASSTADRRAGAGDVAVEARRGTRIPGLCWEAVLRHRRARRVPDIETDLQVRPDDPGVPGRDGGAPPPRYRGTALGVLACSID
jgi:hypothetical protein